MFGFEVADIVLIPLFGWPWRDIILGVETESGYEIGRHCGHIFLKDISIESLADTQPQAQLNESYAA
jgi:hypothetical protein